MLAAAAPRVVVVAGSFEPCRWARCRRGGGYRSAVGAGVATAVPWSSCTETCTLVVAWPMAHGVVVVSFTERAGGGGGAEGGATTVWDVLVQRRPCGDGLMRYE